MRTCWILLLGLTTPLGAQDTLLVSADNAPVWGTGLELVEELKIGALDGPEHEIFGRIVGIVADSAGTIYVADSQVPVVRVFDRDGNYQGSLGRSGEGPGEFLRINGIAALPGGRIVVQDVSRARGIVFGPGLVHETEFPLLSGLNSVGPTIQTDAEGYVYVRAVAFDPSQPPAQLQGLEEWPFVWIKHDPSGGVVDSIDAPPEEAEGPSFTMITGDGPRFPFTVKTLSAISPAGYLIWGRNDQYAFHRSLPDGRVVRVTRTAPRLEATPEERAEWNAVAAYFERRNGSSHPPVPSEKPYFRALSADIEGRVWVQRYTTPYRYEYSADELEERGDRPTIEWREAQTYDVFEPQGRFLGTVTLPRQTRLSFARGMQIWAVAVGEFDEPYAVRFTIRSPSGR